MAFSKDGTITLTKEEGFEVVDRMENALMLLSCRMPLFQVSILIIFSDEVTGYSNNVLCLDFCLQ